MGLFKAIAESSKNRQAAKVAIAQTKADTEKQKIQADKVKSKQDAKRAQADAVIVLAIIIGVIIYLKRRKK